MKPSRSGLQWLKFIVTSRPYEDIQNHFEDIPSSLPTIRLRGEDENDQIHKEIDSVIQTRVTELAQKQKLGVQTQARLQQKLLDMENRTYLWLHLAFDEINYNYRNSLWPDQEVLNLLPTSVEDAYEKILNRIKDRQRDIVKTILLIVAGARRPLSVGEMAQALSIANTTGIGMQIDFNVAPKDILQEKNSPPVWIIHIHKPF